MRHNTDSMFLPTNSASLSMIYYATNYSTKLDTPLWKRIALMLDLFDGLDEGAHGVTPTGGSDTAQTAQRNNKTRQFFARLANQIFTSREISSVENWGNITLSALYWVLFRRWNHLRDAADPETRLRAAPEFVSFGPGGRSLPALEAYTHRGPILEEPCFYDYVALELRPIPKQAVPVMSGYLDYDLRGTEEGFYQREVFAAKELSSRLVITATSGTAAAGIGGTTIHSAVGLTFKDQDGQTSDTTLTASLDKAKQRWRRRDVLVIDEVSMLGLPTLYDIDQKLRMLRGFADKPFGGMPVAIFTGDFLQFPPVNQSSLLKDFTKLPDITTHTRPSRNASEKRWKEMEA
ncbi:PIF1-like helicase-domain-containing protein [Colletotrichum phormii]|uniref:ATP-dependent DNA helicase n=1 Tax=Colletotrichum phormii TaxID=359342 RepID=A0AAI9ZIW8_9PEZI|nr:PIF1-like helicase-domain-containing protein [Colletotrichum phormii]KAK1625429.1 PIF1-like helicase-domain-containing protein [Colletotrichum phormii]